MGTIVFQSYRTERVPAWITTCMATVREWAAAQGFDYEFLDDRFLDLAPPWFREKAGPEICPVTDLARLVAARNYLERGCTRAIWVDADMLMFAPRHMSLDVVDGYAFCREVWTNIAPDGTPQFEHRANNAVSVFDTGNVQLDFLIDAFQRVARPQAQLRRIVYSRTLTRLAAVAPMPVVECIGIFSPALMADVASGRDRLLPAYAREVRAPLAGANMCGSLVGKAGNAAQAGEAAYQAVIRRCLDSGGEVVNRHRG
jgi:hypothetical protein